MSLSKLDLWLRGFSPTAIYEGEGDMNEEAPKTTRTRHDVGKPEAQKDPIFLFQRKGNFGQWDTEYVFFTREEAEEWGKAYSYRYRRGGWRVYCVSALGELADVLRMPEQLASYPLPDHQFPSEQAKSIVAYLESKAGQKVTDRTLVTDETLRFFDAAWEDGKLTCAKCKRQVDIVYAHRGQAWCRDCVSGDQA